MRRGKVTHDSRTRTITHHAMVEVRFDITLDPTPYERHSVGSLVAPVADGLVVLSVIVNGQVSGTKMRFPALRQIERKLPDFVVRNMNQIENNPSQ